MNQRIIFVQKIEQPGLNLFKHVHHMTWSVETKATNLNLNLLVLDYKTWRWRYYAKGMLNQVNDIIANPPIRLN